MFAISASERLISGVTTIIHNVGLSTLLAGEYQKTEVLLCPTQAISISKNLIDNSKCIACGICKKLFPDIIAYRAEEGDTLKFMDYCKSHKMFVYRWLCLTCDELSGTEVLIKGFSRSKRIPFVSVSGNIVKLIKCASSIKELDRVNADLDDMIYLAATIVEASKLKKSMVLIQEISDQEEKDYPTSVRGCSIVQLSKLYNQLAYNMM